MAQQPFFRPQPPAPGTMSYVAQPQPQAALSANLDSYLQRSQPTLAPQSSPFQDARTWRAANNGDALHDPSPYGAAVEGAPAYYDARLNATAATGVATEFTQDFPYPDRSSVDARVVLPSKVVSARGQNWAHDTCGDYHSTTPYLMRRGRPQPASADAFTDRLHRRSYNHVGFRVRVCDAISSFFRRRSLIQNTHMITVIGARLCYDDGWASCEYTPNNIIAGARLARASAGRKCSHVCTLPR
jgi:hypothetical protein